MILSWNEKFYPFIGIMSGQNLGRMGGTIYVLGIHHLAFHLPQ